MARPRKKATPAPKPPAATGTAWDRLSGGAQHGVCLAILLAVAVGFFAPALFSGKSLIGGDTVQWRATAQSMLDYRAEEGEEPLWATNTFAGMPGYLISYERAVPQLDAIPAWLRGFAWPASHFVFLLLGTYLLVVVLTQNKLGAVLAAVAYGLTTYLPVILVAGHNTKFVALCFAPWLVLAFVFALRRPGLLAGLLFAAALAVNLRAGHVQITYYVAFLLGVWWLAEGAGALRRKDAKPFGRATAWLALGAVLGVLMVADPYLVTAEYKNYSIRGAASGGAEGSLAWDYAMGWSQGWGELVTLLIADAYGGSAAYWGPKPFTGGPHYVGGIVLLLAGLALWRYRRNAVTALGLGTLLMVLFSLGEHLELVNRPMFAFFPLFDAFRVPETWLSIVAFALAVLAGLGLFYVVRPEAERGAAARKTRAVEIACGVAVGLALLLWGGKSVFFDFEKDGEYEQIVRLVEQQRPDLAPQADAIAAQELDRRAEERAGAYAGDALRTLIFLALAALALVAYRREKIPAWALQAALVLLVVIDLGGVGRRYFNEDVLRPAPDPQAAIPTYGFDRYLVQQVEAAGGPGHFRVLSLEGDPTTAARPSYHYESLGGYHGAKLRLYQDFLEQILFDPETGRLNENALDLLNTRYLVAQGTFPGAEVVFEDEQTGFSVLENPDAVPRAFLVGETEVIEDAEATWQRLRDPGFDPRRTAILPAPLDFEPVPLDSSSTASVELMAYGPREIRWQVETDAPRLLVVSEIFYPAGWTATVGGEDAPILRADYLLRAVPVPAGRHEVVMRFAPQTYRLGRWIAGGTTVLVYGALLVLLGLRVVRRRRDAGEPEAAE